MSPASPHFFPLAHPLVLGLLFVLGLLIALIEIGLIGYAYEKIGVQRRYVFAVLLLSLLGSYVNIPIAALPAERVVSGQEVTFFWHALRHPAGRRMAADGARRQRRRGRDPDAPLSVSTGHNWDVRASRFDGHFLTGILAVLLA